MADWVGAKNVCHPIWEGDEIKRVYGTHLRNINVPGKIGDKVDELASKLSVQLDHWPRKLALYDFHAWAEKHSLQSPERLALLGDAPEAELLTPKSRLEHFFVPGQNDLHDAKAMQKVKDFGPSMILLGDVFQSLHDPQLAMSNVFDALEDGGYVFLCAPLTGVADQMPFHFYHSTWMGLSVLLESSGFETVEVRQWGNLQYELEIMKLNARPKRSDLKDWESDKNHADYAWGLWRKSISKYQAQCNRPNTRWLSHRAVEAREIQELWSSLVQPNISVGHVTWETYKIEKGVGGWKDSNDFPRVPALLHYRDLLMKYASQIKETPQLLTFGGLEYEIRHGPQKRKVVDFGPYRGSTGDLHRLNISAIETKLLTGTSGVDFCNFALCS